jgi:preprotein translocase subunit SecY|uniref:Protein translocase subunit SecY n=1 Tax=candidate division CPR3 bacterium TaxID=2268181 RepID=A0A7V3N629_UNCC3
MIETLKKIFSLKDLRKRILYTIVLLLIFRVLAHVPLPGVDITKLKQFFATNQIFGLLDLFSGGTMSNFSIVMMGVGPYITASIVMQLLTVVVPSLEALSKEGEWGRERINYYTRLLTVPLALIEAFGMLQLLRKGTQIQILESLTPFQAAILLISITSGTILLMWLGELISENGIGNGISLIITLGIISGFPNQIRNTFTLIFGGTVIDWGKMLGFILFIVIAVATVALIVFVNEGQRNIPIFYARRVQGLKTYGGIETHLPLRVNMAGVIPIIFALSLMVFPGVVARFFTVAKSAWLSNAASYVDHLFKENTFYGTFYFILVVIFTYFYTYVIFHPEEVAENLQKQGAFIPGMRPGAQTASYLTGVVNRILLAGALFLGVIAVLPFIVQAFTKINTLVLGGTGLLIVVSVVLETARQIKSQLIMRTYEEY